MTHKGFGLFVNEHIIFLGMGGKIPEDPEACLLAIMT